jgi:hypothetical protein
MRDDKDPQCSVISTSPGMFRNWQRAFPSSYCAECAANARTDSDRYAELRKLVEAYQNAKCYEDDEPLKALREWSHH